MWQPTESRIYSFINGQISLDSCDEKSSEEKSSGQGSSKAVSESEVDSWQLRFSATNEKTYEVFGASDGQIDRAMNEAQEAFEVWSQTPVETRSKALQKLADLLFENRDELARLEVIDTGRPLREILSYDIDSAIECLRYYANLIADTTLEYHKFDGSHGYVLREPLGVCVGIGAWNFPLQVLTWKLAPALAMGNTVVLKPSEFTPTTMTCLASLAIDAGIPEGVIQVIQGRGEVGQKLVSHPLTKKVSFTGSVPTGRKVAAQASSDLKPVTMELGGKSPLVIFEDADLDQAANIAMIANYYACGQVCTNGTRVFVHQDIHDEFVQKVVEKVSKFKVGDPREHSTVYSGVIHHEHLKKVLGFVERAKDEGATLVFGGKHPFALENSNPCFEGAYMLPVILTDCFDEMEVVREEVFGPVMSVLKFKDEDEVISRANNSPYGLAAGVVSADLVRGQRVAEQLEAGVCWVNTYNDTPLALPFGGVKFSGLGRENGREVLHHYSQTKSILVSTTPVANVFES